MKAELSTFGESLHTCPKCARESLAKTGPHLYHCIWCNFRRDISSNNDGAATPLIAFIGGAILLMLAL